MWPWCKINGEELEAVAGGWESEHTVPEAGAWYRLCRSNEIGGGMGAYPTHTVFRCIRVSSHDEAAFEQYEQVVKPEGIVLTYVQNIQGDPADFSKILDPNIWPVW